mmetsp:Transcript_46622/g.101291  ORF Transcript_46622/g.101291 Transcript_46622/m.101291 type:complete len:588 (+) Transcript_46622:28-1791(+)|eukprot:CAMPEP_0204333628 /NCGR_PEP_ID=MMETSP0469-20131031/17365_1 /ASSEMBLY_ACC=CAM_ASM_000384 /TAXON_ID=2969 /ORGANISM="Oxyrrhis marina" /LENGTH=587 /DNA_ID=CAMNT_0051317001 /DNA_START=45 /DNA_END=1808 /DNA_ORIENTATION=-
MSCTSDGSWFAAENTFVEATLRAHEITSRVLVSFSDGDGKQFTDGPEWSDVFERDPQLERPDYVGWFASQEIDDAESLANAPTAWRRLSSWTNAEVWPRSVKGRAVFGPILQGRLSNMYLIEAMHACATRPELLTFLFTDYAPDLGLYVLRFFKNGCWVTEYVDDYIPVDGFGEPWCCQSTQFPNVVWPCVVEKAYAKLHGSWESIGFGGDVEDALTDLTGGVCGRFSTKETPVDRLFAYLYYWQTEAIFVARVDETACREQLVNLPGHASYAINRLRIWNEYMFVQVLSSAAAPACLTSRVPQQLMASVAEDSSSGYFWLCMEDFAALFSAVIECRLVNSDCEFVTAKLQLDACDRLDAPLRPPWLPLALEARLPGIGDFEGAFFSGPWYEYVFATAEQVTDSTAPEFYMQVNAVPCEMTLSIGQADKRVGLQCQRERRHAPLLLRVFQQWGHPTEDKWVFVSQSSWRHCRDAMASIKVTMPGMYLAVVSLPSQGEEESRLCHRMVFRAYTTAKITVEPRSPQGSHAMVQPTTSVGAVSLTLVGSVGTSLPEDTDVSEGFGSAANSNASLESSDVQNGANGDCTVA